MKKVGKTKAEVDQTINNNPTEQQTPSFNYAEEQKKIANSLADVSPSVLDSLENDNAVDLDKIAREDAGPAFADPEEATSRGMTNLPKEFYDAQKEKGFQPAIEVTRRKTGFSAGEEQEQLFNLAGKTFRELSDQQKAEVLSKELAKPASEQDLSNLDESMIMAMPQIKASSFKIIDMLNPKPKDKNMRLRWANCINNVAGNLGRYMAIGFKVASVDDVDQTKTPIDPSMISGSQVKYHDVVLLKIHVLELMGLYKSNVMRSIAKLGRIREKGIAEANRQFAASLSETPGAIQGYNKIKAGLAGREPVEFFTPGMEESNVVSSR